MITRRKLLVVLGTAALAAPLASLAQPQGKLRRIGFLWETTPPTNNLAAFKRGMSELGYTEGKSYAVEHRAAQTDNARLPALAAELVALKVDVIVCQGTPSAVAAIKATREIPILITTTADPVGVGLAAALARPGGNVTGVTQGVGHDLITKRLDLLRQIVPGLRRVGFLYDPDNAGVVAALRRFESDCSKLELKPLRAPVSKPEDIAAAFNALTRDEAQGLLVNNHNRFGAPPVSIIQHAATHRLAAIYISGAVVEAGGLIGYAPNFPDLWRRAAAYADS